jgi:hypothetical protein
MLNNNKMLRQRLFATRRRNSAMVLLSLMSGLLLAEGHAAESKAIYVGREQPAVRADYRQDHRQDYRKDYRQHDRQDHRQYQYEPQYRVLNRSRGYEPPPMISASIRGSRASAQFNYHAPTVTTINKTVQIIPPQGGSVGDVSYSQDQYYIYPDQRYPQYQQPRRRHYQRVETIVDDPQVTEQRSKQWTDKGDFYP